MSQTQALRVKIPTFGYGDRLRRIRQDQDLGQRVFAASLGMTASTYARHELLDEVPRGARLVANSIQLVYGIPAWWVLGQPSPEECAVRDSNPEPAGKAYAQVTRLHLAHAA